MTRGETADARAVCSLCPARRDCLIWAVLEDEGFGMWGGYNAPERARMVEQWGSNALEPETKPDAVKALPAILAAYDMGILDDQVIRL